MGQDVTLTRHRTFTLPKEGNSWEECEDAFGCDERAGRFAVSDGASESIYAGEWARLLCQAFVAESSAPGGIGPWLKSAQRRWKRMVGDQQVPWHIEEKLRDGAFATFLGLTIGPEADGAGRSWQAFATGDTCLFLIRDDALRRAFPIETASSFGTRPDLLCSLRRGKLHAAAVRGTLSAGDRLLMMTDALAEWFLTEHQEGRKPWQDVERLTQGTFPKWVDGLRGARRLKNDDVTLVVIDIERANSSPADVVSS